MWVPPSRHNGGTRSEHQRSFTVDSLATVVSRGLFGQLSEAIPWARSANQKLPKATPAKEDQPAIAQLSCSEERAQQLPNEHPHQGGGHPIAAVPIRGAPHVGSWVLKVKLVGHRSNPHQSGHALPQHYTPSTILKGSRVGSLQGNDVQENGDWCLTNFARVIHDSAGWPCQ